METPASVPPAQPVLTIQQITHPLGIFGAIFALVTVILLTWLLVLLFRSRPLSDYLAYIAATLYPFLLGILSGVLSYNHWSKAIGDNGIGLADPNLLTACVIEISLRLLCGILLTCLFFPCAILVLLVRKPK